MSEKKELEELIKLAEQEVVAPKNAQVHPEALHNAVISKKGVNDVQRFILALDLKPGKAKCSSRGIYEIYKYWSENPLKKPAFMLEFSKFFLPERTAKYRFYLLKMNLIEYKWKVDSIKNAKK
jgi:hypothetical protein